MVYFNFNYVTDPPNDETVDEVTQLNDNWSELDTKLQGWNQKPSNIVAPIPVGTEALDPEHPGDEYRIAVYNGTNWVRSLNHILTWEAWQDLDIRSPVVSRPGFPPRIRVNQWKREIMLSGGVLFNAAADPWPTGSDVEITSDTAIQSSLAPVPGGRICYQAATSQVTAANSFASAVIAVNIETTPARTSIKIRHQGDAGGGNFAMLDGLKWWY